MLVPIRSILRGMWAVVVAAGVAPGCGGPTPLSCKNLTPTEEACLACTNARCTDALSNLQSACNGSAACLAACDCNDTRCAMNCAFGFEGDQACGCAVLDLNACEISFCPATCGTAGPYLTHLRSTRHRDEEDAAPAS